MSQPSSQSSHGLSVDFSDELSKNLTIHKNVNQEIIITTSDKIKLVLLSTKEILTSQRDWWTPFGLMISFITTMCTADFKHSFGISKEFWQAIFVLLTILSFLWFCKSIYRLIKNWGNDDLDKIIAQIKVNEQSISTN
jgi:hypothetical protein